MRKRQVIENMEALYRQGIKTRKDYLRFTSERRRNEIDMVNAEIAIERSGVEIKRLLGMVTSPMDIDSERTFAPLEVQTVLADPVPTAAPDISKHFRVQMVDLQLEVLKNNIAVAERKFWPQLYLNAAANTIGSDYLGVGRSFAGFSGTNWSVLATLKLNLMDWGIRRKDIEIASQDKIIQEGQLRDSLNTFVADNKKLMMNLHQSHSNYKLSRELLEIETKTYELLKSEYHNGKVTYLDLIVGLRDLLAARIVTGKQIGRAHV